ncbi:GNAT family N-acetyltransferase [Fibrella forsythiae]|uniref:GNAT family N-acetyltransferase n=1 Tax=Fibrella forsythiae TaxID=2817061 RepID=A0ABS3JR63_9BACT|nr:GNAT family N-acetyltransferase [Fibrella forsythiae]MBO0952503.1 GNAT family N-acetyltransferase [Fibrella forsythiae]
MLRFLTRRQIDDVAWNQCVSTAHNALLYGHTWYLDAVTNVPDWRWEGLVLGNVPEPVVGYERTGQYKAVLPIPLRRRWGRWVVYQPLFCQFLAIFSPQPVDAEPFLRAVFDRYNHASTWNLLLEKPAFGLPDQVRQQVRYTHVLPFRKGTNAYTADRRMNLRRAARRIGNVPDWQLRRSTDIEPLLALFRENHATEIGVGEWAYDLFRGVFTVIRQQGLGTLHYAYVAGQLVAGALFVEQHGRIIYLFNAANAEGRQLNARSILLDRLIRDEQKKATMSAQLLDFESPAKPGVVSFYESFGAEPQPYITLTWSRLGWLERAALTGLKQLKRLIS